MQNQTLPLSVEWRQCDTLTPLIIYHYTRNSACIKTDIPGREPRNVNMGWSLSAVCSLSRPVRCREAMQGAGSTSTHSHQHMMPKYVCVKKCSKTPQTPTVLALETPQQVFSRRRNGKNSSAFSGGHRRMVSDPEDQAGNSFWFFPWNKQLLTTSTIHNPCKLDQISNKLSAFSSM